MTRKRASSIIQSTTPSNFAELVGNGDTQIQLDALQSSISKVSPPSASTAKGAPAKTARKRTLSDEAKELQDGQQVQNKRSKVQLNPSTAGSLASVDAAQHLTVPLEVILAAESITQRILHHSRAKVSRHCPSPTYMELADKLHILAKSPPTATDLSERRRWVVDLRIYKGKHIDVDVDGKVNPSKYGSTIQKDLGLCYQTFMAKSYCPFGSWCYWRHKRLDKSEKEWLVQLGAGDVAEHANLCWATPQPPIESTLF